MAPTDPKKKMMKKKKGKKPSSQKDARIATDGDQPLSSPTHRNSFVPRKSSEITSIMSSANDDNAVRVERLKKEIDSMRGKISSMAPNRTREDLMSKAGQQHLLAKKVEEYELLLETERLASVVREHEELHPPQTDDCPICLEPMKITDTKVQHFACCGNSFCKKCGEYNYEHGYLTSCPLCRAPPARGEVIQRKLEKERAEDGRAWAQYNLGLYHLDGRKGFPLDTKEALRWFGLAAEQHFPDALVKLAELYYEGRDGMVKQSYSKAFSLFKEAADVGCANGQTNVGNMYTNGGQGVGVNKSMAVYYFTLAYSQNQCRNAGYQLGCFFATGVIGGLNKSLVRAKYYLEGAAKQGMGSAYSPLATTLMTLCQEQYDGSPNIPGHSCIPQLFYWTRKAASEDDENAIIALQNLKEMERYENASCSNCYKDARSHPEKMKRCTRCKAEWYCGRDCQRIHWKEGHKFDCA